jgi:hypothetical protein
LATYAETIRLNAGSTYTGQAANITVTFRDNTGTAYTPTVGAWTEFPAGSGSYFALVSNMDTTKLPVVFACLITGSAFLGAAGSVGGDRAAEIADGYNAAAATAIGTASTQATAANGKLLGNVAAQTGDAFAQGVTNASLINGMAAAMWDTLTSATRTAGSYGAKLKAWVLGTDSKALLSTDAGNTVQLPTIVPTGYGGSGGGLTTGQQTELDNIQTHVTAISTSGNLLSTGDVNAILAALFASNRWQKIEAVDTGAYTEAGNLYTFTRQDGTTFTETLGGTTGAQTRTAGA